MQAHRTFSRGFIDPNRGVDFIDQGGVLANVQLTAESLPDSGLVLAQKRRSPSGFKHLLWIQVAVKLDEFRHRPRPTRLMAGPQARSVVSVEVLVKQQVILPMGIGLELLHSPIHGTPALLVTKEDALQAGRYLPAHLKKVHQVA